MGKRTEEGREEVFGGDSDLKSDRDEKKKGGKIVRFFLETIALAKE